ncbi:MAG: 4'-phosphopantetheinyl transferase superfamily protein [Deltaproteobacteria bacterium]|nr:4'-phosphopantetheinyl transferase superfamily protein [Deltaproteobacteria bacterium]
MHCSLKENILFDSSDAQWPGFECVWSSPPSILNIIDNVIHIWRINLDVPVKIITAFDEILSNEEKHKAEKYHSDADKRRYSASHGSLRIILGKYLHTAPEDIRYSCDSSGKPFLSSDINIRSLYFNLSHSGNYALCAVTQNCSVGIDLEHIRPASDILSMARRFFSCNENEIIFSLHPYQRQQAFYCLWTLKEAYLKATGNGLASLKNTEIVFSIDGFPASIRETGKGYEPGDWTILRFKPAPDYAAGLVVKGKDKKTYKFYDFFNG